jgi:hypothetical protein
MLLPARSLSRVGFTSLGHAERCRATGADQLTVAQAMAEAAAT